MGQTRFLPVGDAAAWQKHRGVGCPEGLKRDFIT